MPEFYRGITMVLPADIEHSAKGTTWKKHEYITIKNGRYIYPSKASLSTAAGNMKNFKQPSKQTSVAMDRPKNDDSEGYRMAEAGVTPTAKVRKANGQWQIVYDVKGGSLEGYPKTTFLGSSVTSKEHAKEIAMKQLEAYQKEIDKYKSTLKHSAKGSEWKDHKYIKRIDGTYYYPDSYKGGRHLPDGEKSDSSSGSSSKEYAYPKTKVDLSGDPTSWSTKQWNYFKKYMAAEISGYTKKNKEFSMEDYVNGKAENFSVILMESLGLDTDKMSDTQISTMQNKLATYIKNTGSTNTTKTSDGEEETSFTLTPEEIEGLAWEVIRGNFANGQQRKELLGEHYSEIQKKVNELWGKKSSDVSDSVKKAGEEALKKVTSSSNTKDFGGTYSVYKKKKATGTLKK